MNELQQQGWTHNWPCESKLRCSNAGGSIMLKDYLQFGSSCHVHPMHGYTSWDVCRKHSPSKHAVCKLCWCKVHGCALGCLEGPGQLDAHKVAPRHPLLVAELFPPRASGCRLLRHPHTATETSNASCQQLLSCCGARHRLPVSSCCCAAPGSASAQ